MLGRVPCQAQCGLAARRSTPSAPRPAAALLRSSRTSRRCPGRSMGAAAPRAVLDVSEATFEKEVLKASGPVLVDFWATWCGPCKLMAVVVTQLEQEYKGTLKVVKVETDPNPKLVEQFGVYGLPTVMLFKDGVPIDGSKKEGALSKAKLVAHMADLGISTPAAA